MHKTSGEATKPNKIKLWENIKSKKQVRMQRKPAVRKTDRKNKPIASVESTQFFQKLIDLIRYGLISLDIINLSTSS